MLKFAFLAILGIAVITLMWKLLKWILAAIGTLVVLLVVLGVCLWFGIQSEPAFYKDLMKEEAECKFVETDSGLMNGKVAQCNREMNRKGEWSIAFTQNELNHWMATEIDKKRPGTISRRVRDVRCQFDKDPSGRNIVRVGARVNVERFKGVVSVDVIPTLKSPNVLDIELCRIRVGSVPLPRRLLLDLLKEKAEEFAIPFEVQYSNGNPVLHVAFSEGELRRGYHPLVIQKLEVGNKQIAVSGDTVE